MSLTRRDFLKGVAGAGAVGPLVLRARPSWAADAVVQHASIGASGMAWSDIRSFAKHPAFKLVAVADVDESRVANVRKQFPDVRVYRDWRELLKAERGKIDSINVSTPDHMHAPIAMSAMRQGVHVYVQKPLAATLHEVRRMTEYAAKHRVVTQMGIQISSAPSQRITEQLIRDGAIGKIREVHTFCDKSWGAEGLLPDTNGPVPPSLDWDKWLGVAEARPYIEGAYHPAEWRKRVGFGTATLGDMGCHILSAPFRGLGLTSPATVTSYGPAPTRDNYPVRARIRYTFTGLPLAAADTLDLWWYDGEERPPDGVVALAGDKMPKTGSLVIGTEGTLVLQHIADPILLPAAQFAGRPMPTVEERDHYGEFLDAVLAAKASGPGAPVKHPSASFGYSGPLTETVLLGTVALWYPNETLEWNARKMKFNNHGDAKRYVERKYRNGWKVKGM